MTHTKSYGRLGQGKEPICVFPNLFLTTGPSFWYQWKWEPQHLILVLNGLQCMNLKFQHHSVRGIFLITDELFCEGNHCYHLLQHCLKTTCLIWISSSHRALGTIH